MNVNIVVTDVVNDVTYIPAKVLIHVLIHVFRKKHRTSDQIFILKTIIDKYINKTGKGNKLYTCSIDFRKAFDTVCHDGLLLKLQRAGINGKIYDLIKSMYQNSTARVKCKNTLIDNIEIKQGVHQGNVLSPLLFNIFINNIGKITFIT